MAIKKNLEEIRFEVPPGAGIKQKESGMPGALMFFTREESILNFSLQLLTAIDEVGLWDEGNPTAGALKEEFIRVLKGKFGMRVEKGEKKDG